MRQSLHETVLYLVRATPRPLPPAPRKRPAAPSPAISADRYRFSAPIGPAVPSEQDTQGVGAELFSCRPETIGDLSPDLQARCARVGLAANPPPVGLFASALDVRNRGRWVTGLARKKSPPLAPCFSHDGFSPLGTAFCLAEMLVNGYDSDNHEKYYFSQ